MPSCLDCKHLKPFGFASFTCLDREGNESGLGESNVNKDDDACARFVAAKWWAECEPARHCRRCGQALCYGEVQNLPLAASVLCGCCDDQETGIGQDTRED